ncbi:hypothetical protein [Paraburkholderia atlantica]|uniref:hypothetical protein n=1 Tax=Paraburkholderia atlantica TaxID=2654982 RepID=UPI0016118DBD|nr:hypothetical protein [Paraburkholderia atlantica]MBB5503942.1 hypothetical protein [Paraburkholderia atlantica]
MPLPTCAVIPSRPDALRLARAQAAMLDLRAGATIVAVEGDLELEFRDHALAWLGSAVLCTSIIVREGEHFISSQRGVMSIRASRAGAAVLIVQASPDDAADLRELVRRAVRRLAGVVARSCRRTT